MSFLTNLEAPERMAAELAQAESAVMENPEDIQAVNALHLARVRAKGNTATLEMIEREFGPPIIGKPRKTKFKSAELLEQQGFVGVYRRE